MPSHSRTRFRRRRLASATNYKVQTVALSQPDALHGSLNLHITRITHRNIEKTPWRALPSSLTHGSTGIVAVACWHSIPYRTPPYPHRTYVQRCSLRVRIRWANAWLRWRLAGSRSAAPHQRPRRPSLKAFLQGSTGVYGVDGRLVVMMKRPHDRLTMEDRQLSFNCPRYITVGFHGGFCVGGYGCGVLSILVPLQSFAFR